MTDEEELNRLLAAHGLDDVRVSGLGKGELGGAERVELRMKRSVDYELINRAMEANDHVTTILLLTLEIEHQTALLIEGIIGSKSEANNLNTLVLMLKSIRFDNDIYRVVDGFRRLRNKFAHEKAASLDAHAAIVNSIFACRPPSPTEDEIVTVSDGKTSYRLDELPTINRLAVYANLAIIFLATAEQIYRFPTPTKRIAVSAKKLPDLK